MRPFNLCRRPVLAAFSIVSLAGQLACTHPVGEDGTIATDPGDASTAPLVGVDGSTDSADHDCHLSLRSLERTSEDGVWQWNGTVDVSPYALREGASPYVLARTVVGDSAGAGWVSLPVFMTDEVTEAGYRVGTVSIDPNWLDTPQPEWTDEKLAQARIELAPYLWLREGGRLFDHNHPAVADNLASYRLTADEDFSFVDDTDTCRAPLEDPATFAPVLSFHEDGSIEQSGALTEGLFVLDYDMDRLPDCRGRKYGGPAWGMFATARFHPSGETTTVHVVAHPNYEESVDVKGYVYIPSGTTALEMWFENNDYWGCRAWDSAGGANHWFEVLPAPEWMGELIYLSTRNSGDQCADGYEVQDQHVVYDTWSRQRAVYSALCFDVYDQGVTDVNDPEMWRNLDVQARLRWPGEATTSQYVNLEGQWGNNARYRFDLHGLDPFVGGCPDVETTESDSGLLTATMEVDFVVNGVSLTDAPLVVDYQQWANPACD